MKAVICPQCQGTGKIPILDSKKFETTNVIEWTYPDCPTCQGKKFVSLDLKKLVKL